MPTTVYSISQRSHVNSTAGPSSALLGIQQAAGYSEEGQRSLLRLSEGCSTPPPTKRAKVMTKLSDGRELFPTDQDIDDFLDKLHCDSNSHADDSD